MQWRVVAALLRKDLLCLYPVVLLGTAVFAGDVLITRMELWPLWEALRQPLVLLASALLVFSVFQLDSAASLADDWLCRPVPRRELLVAKGLLVLGVVYLSRVLAVLVVDAVQRRPFAETLTDALLLQDEFFLMLLAVLVMTAVTTRTTVQALGVLMAVFVAAMLLPTLLIPAPAPTEVSIGDALLQNGMGWMVLVPAKLAAVLLTALCCGLVYWRRRLTAARVVLGAAVLGGLALFIVPMWLLPWDTLRGAQHLVTPAPPGPGPGGIGISLHTPRTCFPATRFAALGSDSAFAAVRQATRVAWWDDSEIVDPGADALAFVTTFQPHGLPLDWRAQLAFVRARYQGADGQTAVDLRPARYLAGAGSTGQFTHAWLLPQDDLRAVTRDGEPRATFTYSFALLQPQRHLVPIDGRRHRVPGLGFCGARRDAARDAVDVDCFVTGAGVAQVSAALPGIRPSAVFGTPDLAPPALGVLRATRLRLSVASARLSSQPTVEITAWRPGGFIERSWTATGVLGADAATCPLPGDPALRQPAGRWRDAVAHETQFITVAEGVSLEVLDYGGSGTPLLLVPGLGATAHSFDTLAPRLAERHRVYALTRRGTGASTRVEHGFDTATLGRDILAVMDALGLPRALLVGASIAGDELTWLGGHHPERLLGLVYLDAAYDRSPREDSRRLRELQAALPPEPPLGEQDLRDYAAFRALQDRRRGPYLPEGELIAFHQAGKPFLAGVPDIDPRVAAAIPAALAAPDYARIAVPVLAMYALGDADRQLKPWYPLDDAAFREMLTELGQRARQARGDSIEQLRSALPDAGIVELPDASHWIFLSNEADVLKAIHDFVERL